MKKRLKFNKFSFAFSLFIQIIFCFVSLAPLSLEAQMVPFSYWKSQGPIAVPAAAAYGVRRVIPSYSGSLIRVRRSSDNAEQDIGFTAGGDLDTAALTTFVGGGNGFIRTWYDQSGNTRHATQTTAGAQPRIVLAGVVEQTNGRPTVRFDGNFWLSVPRPVLDDWTLVATFTATHTHSSMNWWDVPAIFGGEMPGLVNDGSFGGVGSGLWFVGTGDAVSPQVRGQYLNMIDGVARVGSQRRLRSSGLVELWVNGIADGSGFGSTTSHNGVTTMAMGASLASGGGNRWIGTMSEIVMYPSHLSDADRIAQELSQATYFTVTHGAPFPTGPSGVYSVRRVVGTYTGSLIRIRRSSDNVEQDIGFDGSGNLDTAAITTFVGANSAFVRTWYDQGIYGFHATQTTNGNQPRIVNAGVLDTANGRPTVRFLGSQWLQVFRPLVYNGTLVSTFRSTNTDTGNWTTVPAIFGGEVTGSARDASWGALLDQRWGFGTGPDSGNTSVFSNTTGLVSNGTLMMGAVRRNFSTGLTELWLRGSTDGSATLNNIPHTSLSFFAIGANCVGCGNRLNGSISEIHGHPTVLSDPDLLTIHESQRDYFGVGLASSVLSCDSGTLDTICYINKEKLLSSASITGTGNLVIQNNGSIARSSPTAVLTLNFNDITVQNGGSLIGNITLNASGNIDFQTGSIFQSNSLGNPGVNNANGSGAGGGVAAGGNGGGGGSYGGLGGSKSGGGAAGVTYGSLTNPVDLGSAGGAGGIGGQGGGAIRVIAGGAVTVNGSLSANGQVGGPMGCTGAGGGSGGSIWITGTSLSGTGTLSSNGGNGGSNGCGQQTGMGGGGGRIAIFGNYNFNGSISVSGGFVGGNEGTVYIDDASSGNICNSGTLSTTCTISSSRVLANGYSIAGTGNLILANGANITVSGGNKTFSIDMDGDVTVQTGATVTGNISNIECQNFTLQSGAVISANFLGHAGGSFSGNGIGSGGGIANSNGGGGGGHGSVGITRGAAGGAVYGSDANPVTWGSGGGAGGAPSIGSNGGGAIRVTATGLATINGNITANGQAATVSGSCHGGGGGAGGSIWISGANLAGTGLLEAVGGQGGPNGCGNGLGAGGGGGRVSLQTSGSYFGGTIDVKAFQIFDLKGSIYSSFADINGICDSGNLSTTCTISTKKYLGDNQLISGTGNLVIASGGQLISQGGEQRLRIDMDGDVTVQSGGLIEANLPVFEMDDLTINSGGIIRATSKGHTGGSIWQNGFGTGGGIHNSNGSGGGGHGGAGGQVIAATAGTTYGSLTNPVTYGSGGGGGGSWGAYATSAVGGAGGGAIKVVAAGNVVLEGTLASNGGQGIGQSSCWGPSGGAGGSIWIVANSFSGAGTIQAFGDVGSGNGCGSPLGPSGGGGRVSVQVVNAPSFFGNVDLSSKFSGLSTPGSSGTLNVEFSNADSICDSGTLATTCTMTSAKLVSDGYALTGSGNLIIASGGELRFSPTATNAAMSIALGGNLTIQSGGKIEANITSLVANNVDIQSGGILRADGRGFQGRVGLSGLGPGGGAYGSSNGGLGGGHGGSGGAILAVSGGTTYGDAANPITWGSAGGAWSGAGGAGGGAIRVNISGILTVNGTLSANGALSPDVSTGCCSIASGGGGAGGSVWITAASVAGTGTIAAAGGGPGIGANIGGGGGGGRVSIETSNLFPGTVNVNGGDFFTHGDNRKPGHVGSFYGTATGNFCDSGDLATTCTISTRKSIPDGFTLTSTGNVVVASGGNIVTTGGNQQMSFNISGNLTVQSGGIIDANITSLVATNVDIQTGGIVRANSKGFIGRWYFAGLGTGGGPAGNSVYGAPGGGHGGQGGRMNTNAGGSTYGNELNPTTWGSAGGGYSTHGGNGGGAIRINNSGTLTVNGSISVNGGDSPNTSTGCCSRASGGGGAGGSVWITSGSLAGSGTISAIGGLVGINGSLGAGGGGGRVSITATNLFPGTVNVNGGYQFINGTDRKPGARGTFVGAATGNICDTGDLATTCTISTRKSVPDGFALTSTGNVVIASGGNLVTSGGNQQMSFNISGNLTVQSGGIIDANITSLVVTNVDVQTGGIIRADSKGFLGEWWFAGNGPGAGAIGTSSGTGGGGHGGTGGSKGGSAGGATYGSSTSPTTWGSSGGGYSTAGGPGGGAIRINASGSVTINGSITATGGTSMNPDGGCCSIVAGGGGAGGSIWITAGSFFGSGSLSVAGGASGTGNGTGAGGGGGRISFDSPTFFNSSVSTLGGYDGVSGQTPGNPGSYFANGNVCDSGDLSTTCTVSSLKTLSDATTISGAGNLIVASGGNLFTFSGAGNRELTINMSGNVKIENGGIIRANIPLLSAVNFEIETGGILNANENGHQGIPASIGTGPGPGAAGVYLQGTGGGGHGGAGATSGTSAGGSSYGSETNPVTWGSSGGGGGTRGGHGGGAVRINISGIMTLNGTITVNGGDSPNGVGLNGTNTGGGGAGGSIWITSNSITGTGTMSAIGGTSGTTTGGSLTVRGGGGGGGRVAVASNRFFRGTLLLSGGGTLGLGSDGTYSNPTTGNICDTGDLATTCTISNPYVLGSSTTITGAGSVVIASGGSLKSFGPLRNIDFNLTGDLTVQNTGLIESNISSLVAANVNVQTGGTISANGMGFRGRMFGTGAGTGGGAAGVYFNGTGGGGHGGAGGSGGSSAGGTTYGSSTNPVTQGSAGGGSGTRGGHGGGAIRINIPGDLTVNGTLSANGGDSPDGINLDGTNSGGGGAGGSIWITATNKLGAGTLSANGGTAGPLTGGVNNRRGSAGGGGRLAGHGTFPGTVSVLPGAGAGTAGGSGTTSP